MCLPGISWFLSARVRYINRGLLKSQSSTTSLSTGWKLFSWIYCISTTSKYSTVALINILFVVMNTVVFSLVLVTYDSIAAGRFPYKQNSFAEDAEDSTSVRLTLDYPCIRLQWVYECRERNVFRLFRDKVAFLNKTRFNLIYNDIYILVSITVTTIF